MYKRIFGSSSFPRSGKISFLHLHVPRTRSIANNRSDEDTDVPELHVNGNNEFSSQSRSSVIILIFMGPLQAWRFFGDTLHAIAYAFAINVMIESPFDRLQKNVMKIFIGGKINRIS